MRESLRQGHTARKWQSWDFARVELCWGRRHLPRASVSHSEVEMQQAMGVKSGNGGSISRGLYLQPLRCSKEKLVNP